MKEKLNWEVEFEKVWDEPRFWTAKTSKGDLSIIKDLKTKKYVLSGFSSDQIFDVFVDKPDDPFKEFDSLIECQQYLEKIIFA